MPSSSSMQSLGGESPNFNMKNIGTVLKVTVGPPFLHNGYILYSSLQLAVWTLELSTMRPGFSEGE